MRKIRELEDFDQSGRLDLKLCSLLRDKSVPPPVKPFLIRKRKVKSLIIFKK